MGHYEITCLKTLIVLNAFVQKTVKARIMVTDIKKWIWILCMQCCKRYFIKYIEHDYLGDEYKIQRFKSDFA